MSFSHANISGIIQPEDSVVMFFVVKREKEYQIISFPLNCKYIDSGNYELENSKENEDNFDNFKKIIAKDKLKLSLNYSNEKNISDLSFEEMIELIQENNLSLENDLLEEKYPVEIFCLHREYYENAINQNFKSDYYIREPKIDFLNNIKNNFLNYKIENDNIFFYNLDNQLIKTFNIEDNEISNFYFNIQEKKESFLRNLDKERLFFYNLFDNKMNPSISIRIYKNNYENIEQKHILNNNHLKQMVDIVF